MRKTYNQQLPLAEVTPDHPKAKEFAQISAMLDGNNSILPGTTRPRNIRQQCWGKRNDG